ncbi:MAG: putative quinol monooxygenase [Verrucomicrobiota bacterium]
MYVILVHFTIKTENVADFREAIISNAAASLETEDGCRVFDVCWDPEDETKALLYEIYDNPAAFDVHMASEHFKSFNETVTPWVADKQVSAWEKAYPENQ